MFLLMFARAGHAHGLGLLALDVYLVLVSWGVLGLLGSGSCCSSWSIVRKSCGALAARHERVDMKD